VKVLFVGKNVYTHTGTCIELGNPAITSITTYNFLFLR
jgi:hypothetical protein